MKNLTFTDIMRRLPMLVAICFMLVAPGGCGAQLEKDTSGGRNGAIPKTEIDDVLLLPQEITHYANVAGERLTIGPVCRNRLLTEFRERYYAPWTDNSSRYDLVETKEYMKKVAKAKWYGVNRRLMPAGKLRGILANCALDNFPSRNEKAISIVPTHLRGLPTHLPLFEATNGYPFDMLQYPQVKANEPLRVLHVSQDGIWLFVESVYSNGWLKARDVAIADQSFIDSWMALPQLVIIRDDVTVKDEKNGTSYRAEIGTFLPLAEAGEAWWEAEVASVGKERKAVSSQSRISRESAGRFPLPFNRENISLIGDQLAGQPYGWGEMHGLRDCSAMLRDLFQPFGIWLPRTATDQIESVRQRLDLSGKQPRDKEEAIRRQAVPFLTLLFKPGHIMLYIGTDSRGRPLVFHNAWSIRVKDSSGEHSQLIGKAVITTLEPGKEAGLVEGSSLIEKMTTISTITDRCLDPQTPDY
jgi:cell wall-associated NlpC family hydrolase